MNNMNAKEGKNQLEESVSTIGEEENHQIWNVLTEDEQFACLLIAGPAAQITGVDAHYIATTGISEQTLSKLVDLKIVSVESLIDIANKFIESKRSDYLPVKRKAETKGVSSLSESEFSLYDRYENCIKISQHKSDSLRYKIANEAFRNFVIQQFEEE